MLAGNHGIPPQPWSRQASSIRPLHRPLADQPHARGWQWRRTARKSCLVSAWILRSSTIGEPRRVRRVSKPGRRLPAGAGKTRSAQPATVFALACGGGMASSRLENPAHACSARCSAKTLGPTHIQYGLKEQCLAACNRANGFLARHRCAVGGADSGTAAAPLLRRAEEPGAANATRWETRGAGAAVLWAKRQRHHQPEGTSLCPPSARLRPSDAQASVHSSQRPWR